MLIARALRRWGQRDGTGLAASVSFYALFAMAPLLVFGVVVTSRTIGPVSYTHLTLPTKSTV